MHNIAIFASGTGTNARKIIEYFEDHPTIKVGIIVSNKKDAKVLEIAQLFGIPIQVIDKKAFYTTSSILDTLKKEGINFIVLAGFLWLVPDYLIKEFEGKMVNIHPALLPKYGGKGMYGMKVHEAVKAAGEKETGITIHFVNENYDQGEVIFQAHAHIDGNDTANDIALKVQKLEHEFFSPIIESLLESLN